MKLYRLTAFITACAAFLSLAGCGENKKETEKNEIRVYTSFFGALGRDIDENNEIQQLIAEKTGALCKETWIDSLDNMSKAFSDMMITNKYPDFMVPDAENYQKLLKANAFIPIDEYWDSYPNIKNYLTEGQWNMMRADDGHIYVMPLFSSCYIRDTSTYHGDEAFWIQVKVLEWAGYPKITTPDDYFDLLERYLEANPTDEDGNKYIGYEILANDTYFFSLDNPPMFLDGYPNDGSCIVDPDTLEAIDYNLSPTAEKWFRKLNEEYHKGVIDPECFLLSSEQYYAKLESGLVLGMVDQNWNFNSHVSNLPSDCSYIPLGVVAEEGIEEHYHSIPAFNGSNGLGISVSCTDPEGALQFVNDLLSPEILNLRFWGVEGEDYMKDDDGVFYQTDEQMNNWRDADYAYKHICLYNYFPYYFGMNQDGINAYCPSNQPQEFYKRLNADVQKCFEAYGVRTFVEMLNEASENPPWYPMWTYTGTLTDDTSGGKVMNQIDAAKHQYLPEIVMSDDFDSAWERYCDAYSKIDSQIYFDTLTEEVRRRCELAE